MKTARAIAKPMDSHALLGFCTSAWTDPRRRQPAEGPPGSAFSGLVSMTLQLYCLRNHADNVGRYLKKQGCQLEEPRFELRKHDYYNPQTGAFVNKTDLMQPQIEQQMQQASNVAPTNYALRSAEEIRADVLDVFDTILTGTDEVPERKPSSLIKTELYPHQKQALHFMVDREQDHSSVADDNRKDSLWKPQVQDNGRKLYRHVITGEENDMRPPQSLGGILADEMGLGKTLSILSLICDDSSLAAAKDFAQKKPAPIPQGSQLLQPVINSRATLLICPLSTMTNWKEQIQEHFPAGSGALRWTRYHGTERFNINMHDLADYDIVVTTYHIVAKDLLDRKRPLPYINWFRIVLDEAHTIRNATSQSNAICSLIGKRRWAVTGTPVQNRLEDLRALFNFIRLHPFHQNQGFNQHILNPFKNADPEVVPKLQMLVQSVTIRRTKEIIKDEVPAKQDIVVKLEFTHSERVLHDWFEKDTQRKVNAVTRGEKMGGHSYVRILTAILNMRLVCAHGRDLLNDDALKTTDGMTIDNPMEIGDDDERFPALNRKAAYEMLEMLETTDTVDCIYCSSKKSILDYTSDDEDEEGDAPDLIGYMTVCYHLICPKHLKKHNEVVADNMYDRNTMRCATCEDMGRPDLFHLSRSDYINFLDERDRMRKDPRLAKKVGSYTGPHTKTRALLNDLEEFKQESAKNPDERPIKRYVACFC